MNFTKQSLTLSITLCLTATAQAETATTKPVLVTATRIELPASNMPGNITVVTREQLLNNPARTLPEVLAQEAGIFSRSLFGNNASNTTLDIRGFGAASAENVLILLDGRRLNDIDQGAIDYSAIPLNNIERIEIIRNGGSVLYGDGASGGAINIVTRQAAGTGEGGVVKLSAGSLGTRQLDADYRINNGRASLLLAGQAVNADGYRDNNELQQRNFQADLRLLNDDSEWYLKASADRQDARLPGERTVDPTINLNELADDRRGTGSPNDWADQDGYSLSGGYSLFVDDGSELVIDGGYRNKDQQSFFDYGGGFSDYLETGLKTWSFTPRLSTVLGSDIHSTFGIDYYHADYDAIQAQAPSTAGTPFGRVSITQQMLAAYAQNWIPLSDQTRLDFGARLQHVKFEGSDTLDSSAPGGTFLTEAADLNRDDTVHMLELGLRHQLTDTTAVYAKASRSARLATVDELFENKFNTATFKTDRTFSPLNPQTGTGLDLGVNHTPGNMQFRANLYYMRLRNEIHFDIASFDNINLDPTRRYGAELSASLPVSERLKMRASYTYARAQFRDGAYSGNEVPLVPRHNASLSGDWTVNSAFTINGAVRYVGKKYFDNDQSNDFGQKIPAYTWVDLAASYDWSQWTARLNINNLFDEEAYDYGVRSTATAGRYNAYPLPERTIMLSISREL